MGSVKEYWIVYPKTKTVRQYDLIDEELHHVRTLSLTDTLKSSVLLNFEMPVAAIFE